MASRALACTRKRVAASSWLLCSLGVGGSLATLCHLQHGPILRRGPSMWGTIPTKWRHQRGIATDAPSQRSRSINQKVEPTAVI